MYGFKQYYSKALIEFNKALKLSTNDTELLYERANAMRLEANSDPNDTIKAYLKFLEIAPKDHRKVPESYYSIAVSLVPKHSINDLICGKLREMCEYTVLNQLPLNDIATTKLKILNCINNSFIRFINNKVIHR